MFGMESIQSGNQVCLLFGKESIESGMERKVMYSTERKLESMYPMMIKCVFQN